MKMMALFAFLLFAISIFGCTRVSKSIEDPTLCELMDNQTEADSCFFEVAKAGKDSTVCADINDSVIKEKCKEETKKP